MTCSTFASWDVDVYDATGKRVLSNTEIKKRAGQLMPFTCTRNFGVPVPPHACTVPDPPISLDLTDSYGLGAGEYMITERRMGDSDKD